MQQDPKFEKYLLSRYGESPSLNNIFRTTLRYIHRRTKRPNFSLTAQDYQACTNPEQQAVVAAHLFYAYFAFGGKPTAAWECLAIDRLWLEDIVTDFRNCLGLSYSDWIHNENALRWTWLLVQLVPESDLALLELAYTRLTRHLVLIMHEEWSVHNQLQFGDPHSSEASDSEEARDFPDHQYLLSGWVADIACFTITALTNNPIFQQSDWLSLLLPELLLRVMKGFLNDHALQERVQELQKATQEQPELNLSKAMLVDSELLGNRMLSELVAYSIIDYHRLPISPEEQSDRTIRLASTIMKKLFTRYKRSEVEWCKLNFLSKEHMILGLCMACATSGRNWQKPEVREKMLADFVRLRDQWDEFPALDALKISKKKIQKIITSYRILEKK